MYIPVLRKIINRNNALIERALPESGELIVHVGDKVEPFNQLGLCKVSYNQLELPAKFTPIENLNYSKILQGSTLGKSDGMYIHAPYNGFLEKNENGTWVFKEVGREYNLLAGSWGSVKNIIEDKSVLIEAYSKDFLLPVATGENYSGELIVFPNPSELLIGSFLENFTKWLSVALN